METDSDSKEFLNDKILVVKKKMVFPEEKTEKRNNVMIREMLFEMLNL